MDPLIITYVLYLVMSVGLTVWVARTLSRHGRSFLRTVFTTDEHLADAVNQLLVVGFYLVNLGLVALWLSTSGRVTNTREAIQLLSVKLGTVALVLGVLHLINIAIFSRMRHNALARQAFNARPPMFGPGQPTSAPPIQGQPIR